LMLGNVAMLLLLLCCGLRHAVADVAGAETKRPVPQPLGPKQLVFWRSEELSLEVPHDWVFNGPIGTVCVAGDDRVGKSTLLSLWAKNLSTEGFEIPEFPAGHTLQSHTKGLWSALLRAEAADLPFHLNLCDSQGLKTTSSSSQLQQWRLHAANVLVPQVLVYMFKDVLNLDQLRDLARFAHLFQKLGNNSQRSEQLQRFGRLSPHLIVLVRDDSNLMNDLNGGNISSHLDQVLDSPGFEEDKNLIRQVFRTHEALSLHKLSDEGQSAVREGNFAAASAQRWRHSGEAALQRVILAIQRRGLLLPHGPELWEWYRSVLLTVNSEEDASLDRLIGHGEKLDRMRHRRRLLQDSFGHVLTLLAGLAIVSAFSSVGVCLDRAAWLAWILLSVCYLGASPLLKMPMRGLAQRFCDHLYLKGSEDIVNAICLEASSQTAAVLVASLLGALSYPLFTAQLRVLLSRLPLPSQLHRSFVTLVLVLVALLMSVLEEVLSEVATSQPLFLTALAVLLLATVIASLRLLQQMLHNCSCATASSVGRGLHFWIAQRDAAVAALEASADWKLHFRRHSQSDTLWRYRKLPLWKSWSRVLQACGLLTWAWLIYPQWDIVFILGASLNLVDLCFALAGWIHGRMQPDGDPVLEWFDDLEDTDSEEEAAASSQEPPILPETPEEEIQRMQIEEMRQEDSWKAARRRISNPAQTPRSS